MGEPKKKSRNLSGKAIQSSNGRAVFWKWLQPRITENPEIALSTINQGQICKAEWFSIKPLNQSARFPQAFGRSSPNKDTGSC